MHQHKYLNKRNLLNYNLNNWKDKMPVPFKVGWRTRKFWSQTLLHLTITDDLCKTLMNSDKLKHTKPRFAINVKTMFKTVRPIHARGLKSRFMLSVTFIMSEDPQVIFCSVKLHSIAFLSVKPFFYVVSLLIYLLSHNRHTTWCCVTVTVDLLKVNYFARTEYCLIEFYTELCIKIAIKHSKYDKILSNCGKNMKKCMFCQFCVPMLKCCAN